ncbi:hypothetical protein WJX84_001332 [Apatococcus fuscideae]|uniref:Uncharacterized protein n=1 Tax=Apatococcus fuscideae TaxID=2026836 RepID=A0AAW1RQZ7_9CHLO
MWLPSSFVSDPKATPQSIRGKTGRPMWRADAQRLAADAQRLTGSFRCGAHAFCADMPLARKCRVRNGRHPWVYDQRHTGIRRCLI